MRDGDGGGDGVTVCARNPCEDAERQHLERRCFSPVGTGPNNGGGSWAGWVLLASSILVRVSAAPPVHHGATRWGSEPDSFTAMHSKHAFSVSTLRHIHLQYL